MKHDWHPIAWRGSGNTPHSELFDDIFFQEDAGLEDVQHVFLDANQLSQRVADAEILTIAETGFGTGLNMLAAWDLFIKHAPASARLNLISTEKHPLQVDDLKRALSVWPQLAPLSERLLALYPSTPYGTHTLKLDPGRVTLTLMFGDAATVLSGSTAKADAWFLDGFAPDRNDAMWSDALYHQIARCSRAGTTLSTFTAAGHVRRALSEAGFDMEKHAGFGQKRHMLRGTMNTPPTPEPPDTPWFSIQPTPQPPGHAAVIGAGLAGAAMAHELCQTGWRVSLFDREEGPACGASGNHLGLAMPRLTRDTTVLSQLTLAGVDAVARTVHDLKSNGHAVEMLPCGVIDLAWNEQEQGRLDDGLDAAQIPASCARKVDAAEASALAGVAVPHAGVWFPHALCVSPRTLCQHLIADCGDALSTRYSQEITSLTYNENMWTLHGEAENASADIVIVCNAHDADRFSQTASLPKKLIRGQSAWLPAHSESASLKTALVYQGYILPAHENIHVVGASYGVHDAFPDLREAEHAQLIRDLQAALPGWTEPDDSDWSPTQGWAGVRMMTPDNLPMIGPAPQHDAYLEHYADLHLGRQYKSYPSGEVHPGLYVSLAHGSRGLMTSILGASLIGALLRSDPAPLDTHLMHALHPARFLIRDIKRGVYT